ncbi:unnamed protein product [Prorocentrum cordatum]|uniref:Ribosomal protein L10e/L16 domain-containing protein n=1 Tax=Prorocentrum cordatum TaxID=2364126 RepID=A0ABN9VTS2_9DINO|nr:unnamed protein product [Polarella glacialis]
MPPVRWKPPLPVRFKVPKGNIVPLPENKQDVLLGKSIVAASPHRVTAEHIEVGRKILRRYMGRKGDFLINIHATYAVTRRAQGVKMGQGKGAIDHFVARVPAGRVMFHVPSLNPLETLGFQPNLEMFREVADKMPMSTRPARFASISGARRRPELGCVSCAGPLGRSEGDCGGGQWRDERGRIEARLGTLSRRRPGVDRCRNCCSR